MTDEPTREPPSRSGWQTMPGMLTAVAGVITAITGLIVALHQIGVGGGGDSGAPAAATSRTVETSPATTAGSDGGDVTQQPTGAAAAYTARFPDGTKATVGTNVYQILRARPERSNPGQVALHLSVRLTNNGNYDANFWNASFRLLVDRVPRAPTNFLDEVVNGHSAMEGEVDFEVPASAKRLVLLVGDDPAKAIRLRVVLKPR